MGPNSASSLTSHFHARQCTLLELCPTISSIPKTVSPVRSSRGLFSNSRISDLGSRFVFVSPGLQSRLVCGATPEGDGKDDSGAVCAQRSDGRRSSKENGPARDAHWVIEIKSRLCTEWQRGGQKSGETSQAGHWQCQ